MITAQSERYLLTLIFTVVVGCRASGILKVLAEVTLAIEATLQGNFCDRRLRSPQQLLGLQCQ